MSDTLTIRYKPTWMNLFRGTAAVLGSSKLVRRIRRVTWAAGALALPVAFGGNVTLATLMLGAFLTFEGALWGGSLSQAVFCVWGAKDWKDEQTIRFRREGFDLEGPVASASIGWEQVSEVRVKRRFAVLVFRGVNGLYVPLRKRLDAVPRDTLIDFIREHEGTPPISEPGPGQVLLVAGPGDVLVSFDAEYPLLKSAMRQVARTGGTAVVSMALLAVVWAAVGLKPLFRFLADPTGATLLVALPGILLAAFYVFLVHETPGWHAKRILKQLPLVDRSQQIQVSAEGVSTRGPLATIAAPWRNVTRAVETQEFFLFFLSRAAALYLPKGQLASPDLDRVRALVREHGPPLMMK